jgi:hypothetical protein
LFKDKELIMSYEAPTNFIVVDDIAYSFINEDNTDVSFRNLTCAPVEEGVVDWSRNTPCGDDTPSEHEDLVLKRIATYLRWAIDLHKFYKDVL